MRCGRVAAALLSMLLLASPSRAADFDSNNTEGLYQVCRSQSAVTMGICYSFVVATFGVMARNGATARNGIPLDDTGPPVKVTDPLALAFLSVMGVCPGTAVSYAAMVQAFENWAAAHPERWSDPSTDSVMAALAAAWPC
jgi:hypothetical protein